MAAGMTPSGVVAVALAVFVLAAAAQAVTGFGMALVAVPLTALVVDPVTAVVATTVVGLVLTSMASWRERRHVEGRVAWRMTFAAVFGMPAGLLLLAGLDERSLQLIIGGGLLVMVLLLVARVRFPTGNGAQYGSGLLSGALLTSTGLNGPPVVLTLQGLDLPPHRFRGTLQVVFCAQDLVAVAAFVALGHVDRLTATVALAGILGVPVGWWLGDRVFGWLPAARFRAVVPSTLGVTALVSLWGALS